MLSMDTITGEERKVWQKKLDDIDEEVEKWEQSLAATNEEEQEHKLQVLEQLGIVKQTKDELTAILNMNEGFSRRVVISTLKKHGVDMKLPRCNDHRQSLLHARRKGRANHG